MALVPLDTFLMELPTELAVEALCVTCPCGNYLFVGRAQESRRARDPRFWNNLKCPTCTSTFTAYLEDVRQRSVPVLLFERGFCTPEALE
jgi:hypothetical protein